jgi:uncharacterized protein (DUF697 family)
MSDEITDLTDIDKEAIETIWRYSYGATGVMILVPIPGVDMAATYAVWAKMISRIAKIYGYDVSFADAKALAADLFKGVVLTTVAWFASAKTASTILKFIPGAGTLVAYTIDATIAAFGAKRITTLLGFAAAAYYKAGRKQPEQSVVDKAFRGIGDRKKVLELLKHLRSPRK